MIYNLILPFDVGGAVALHVRHLGLQSVGRGFNPARGNAA